MKPLLAILLLGLLLVQVSLAKSKKEEDEDLSKHSNLRTGKVAVSTSQDSDLRFEHHNQLVNTIDLAVETIEILLRDKYDVTENHLGHIQIIYLLKFCIKTFFKFDGTIHEQVKGTPMGSPISGLIAEAVQQRLETLISRHHRLKFWARLGADIGCDHGNGDDDGDNSGGGGGGGGRSCGCDGSHNHRVCRRRPETVHPRPPSHSSPLVLFSVDSPPPPPPPPPVPPRELSSLGRHAQGLRATKL
nr:unnamed protein product [Spirometra erinaceieuropaei]